MNEGIEEVTKRRLRTKERTNIHVFKLSKAIEISSLEFLEYSRVLLEEQALSKISVFLNLIRTVRPWDLDLKLFSLEVLENPFI